MARFPNFDPRNLGRRIRPNVLDRQLLDRFLLTALDSKVSGPQIADFQPWQGHPGTVVAIVGGGFSNHRGLNQVKVGGQPAFVIEAAPERLLVLTSMAVQTGPVEVTVDSKTGAGPRPFEKLAWPKPGSEEDGPPYSYAGMGAGTGPSAGSVPSTGTARILVVACNPTDVVPSNVNTAKQDIVDTFANVTKFYDQASYDQLDVQVDVTDYVALLNDEDYYHRSNGAPGYPNIDASVLGQLMAECAQGALDQGLDLNDYSVLVASVFMTESVRAWGGWSASNFSYDDGAGTSINITVSNALGLIAQRHDADWGRAAHEFAHNILDGGLVLGEDVYGSDLVDSSEATASKFAMMGNHDSHPLFSAYNIDQMGWYSSANVEKRDWDRNPFSEEFDIASHSLNEDSTASRIHLLEIKISSGLSYWVEVRQRPDSSAAIPAIFDENIPLAAGGRDGGVVVTKVVTGELNNNHQSRLITLLQDEKRVLGTGEEASDPLRTIRITVVDDNVQARPRVCRVRVEWAQEIADTPGGDFDLRIEPWGPGWETEDIWIDRDPFGSFDFEDAAGNPTGNGDEPRPMEVNRFYARVRNDGTADASAVRVTHYAISPPGVGDNGNWTPLSSRTIASIAANGTAEGFVNWVPTVGEHTCLKVAIDQQLGEVTGGNNQAQENVFNFQPAASSIAEPVKLTVAVRNPLNKRTLVMISLEDVPFGYYVYFPHRWVWLDPKAERKLDLLIIPLFDPANNPATDKLIRSSKRGVPRARIRLYGRLPHVYTKPLEMTGVPASWMSPIGGVLAHVEPKRRGQIDLDPNVESDGEVCIVRGCVAPSIKCQRVYVDMICPDGSVVRVMTDTDDRGCFVARFKCPTFADENNEASVPRTPSIPERDPTGQDQRTNCPPKHPAGPQPSKPVTTLHSCAFQARITNASHIAPTESKFVHWA